MALPTEKYVRTILSDTLTVTKIDGGYIYQDAQGQNRTSSFITDAQAGETGANTVTAISSNTTAEITTKTYAVDTSSGNVRLTFDSAEYTNGDYWNVKLIDATNKITLATTSGTIDGYSEVDITVLNTNLTIQFDGTNYIIL